MIKVILLLLTGLISSMVLAEKPVGFLWYNLPREAAPSHKPKGVPFSQLSYTDKDAVLHFYTMEALHKVRFTHQLEDERVFLALQDYWLKEATIHGALNQKALLYYPEFDFSVSHPTSHLGSKYYDTAQIQKQKETVASLAKTHGLFFFYRGKSALDVEQIPILRDFCQKFNFHLIPITVDGEKAPSMPDTRMDDGQAARLGVRYFPAILLVNPRTAQFTPVAFGLTTQDVLMRHLNIVAHDFNVEAS